MAIDLYYKTIGEGKPLVILHGVFGSGENWLTVSKQFSPYYQVFMVDQRNHGRSPHTEDFSYDLMVEDLLHFANRQGFSTFDLIGHSMGGKVAMKFAAAQGQRLAHLVVVDIAPRFYKPHHHEIMAGLKAVDLLHCTSRKEAEEAMVPFIPLADVRQFLLKNLYRTEDGKFAWRIHLAVLEKAIEFIGEPLDPSVKIDIPTLFLRGANSAYIQDEDAVQIANQFTNSKIITIPNAGHWIQAEQPLAFAEAVLPFLANSK